MCQRYSCYDLRPLAYRIDPHLCFKGDFIGADFGIDFDLTDYLDHGWNDFLTYFRPIIRDLIPDIGNGIASIYASFLWRVVTGIQTGDVILCLNNDNKFYLGEIIDAYSYSPRLYMPHRRFVQWYPYIIEREDVDTATHIVDPSRFIKSYYIDGQELLKNLRNKQNNIMNLSEDETRLKKMLHSEPDLRSIIRVTNPAFRRISVEAFETVIRKSKIH